MSEPVSEGVRGSSTSRGGDAAAGNPSGEPASQQPAADNVPVQIQGLSTLETAPPSARPAGSEGNNTVDAGAEVRSAAGKDEIIAAPRPAEGGVGSADAPQQQGGSERLEEKGVEDLGWNTSDGGRPIPVLHGLPNEELWLLIRRFNKQTYRVRRIDEHNRDSAQDAGEKAGVRPGAGQEAAAGASEPQNDAAASVSKAQHRRLRRLRRKRGRHLTALDMNVSPSEEFTPEKLRSTLERVYITVIVGLAAGATHVARLRSWREGKRSAFFALLYAVAWGVNMLEPAFFALLIVLVLSDAARAALFPAAPLAAFDARTGEPKVPAAGHLGSQASLTGAAEAYKGEAVEQEASNLVGVIGSVAVSTAAGSTKAKHADEEDDEDDSDFEGARAQGGDGSGGKDKKEEGDALDAMPSIATAVSKGAELKLAAEGEANNANAAATQAKGGGGGKDESATIKKDHTKEPMEKAVWKSLNPALHALNEVADYWERIENALNATPPFAKYIPRYRLAGALVPLMLATAFGNSQLVWRGMTLGMGIGLFGQPLFDRLKPEPLLGWLDAHFPHWKEALEPRNNLLRGIPTNAQLAVTLLRIGEVNRCPLPPPPPASAAPPPSAHKGEAMADHPDVPDEHREQMAAQAAEHADKEAREAQAVQGEGGTGAPAGRKKAMLLGLVKGTVKIGVETLLGGNRVKASIGSLPAKVRLGVVQDPLTAERRRIGDGPISFRARYKGKRGLIFISTQATSPCLSFERVGLLSGEPKSKTTAIKDKLEGKEEARADARVERSAEEELAAREEKAGKDGAAADDNVQQSAVFSIAIDDMVQIRKVGGLSWVSKAVVGWALGSEVADGLEIVDSAGREYKLTGINRRDEAFNRLVAIGKQKWELF